MQKKKRAGDGGVDVAIVARNLKVLPVIASNLLCRAFAPYSD